MTKEKEKVKEIICPNGCIKIVDGKLVSSGRYKERLKAFEKDKKHCPVCGAELSKILFHKTK